MRQIHMMVIATRMQAGQAFWISGPDMREAAGADLPAMDKPARDSDVAEYIAKISANWGVKVIHNTFDDGYTMHKMPNPQFSGDSERNHQRRMTMPTTNDQPTSREEYPAKCCSTSSLLYEKACMERTAYYLSLSPMCQARAIAKHYCAYAMIARDLLEIIECVAQGSNQNADAAVEHIVKAITDGHAHDFGLPLAWSNPSLQGDGPPCGPYPARRCWKSE